jgi:hypothetical protein
MGLGEEDDKQFLIYDKQTGQLLDIRNECHLQKLQGKQAKLGELSTSDLDLQEIDHAK